MKCFGRPLNCGHAVLSELEEKFILCKTYHSPLCSHQIFKSQPSGSLSIITHKFFMYLSMGFLLGPMLHSAAHPVAWE